MGGLYPLLPGIYSSNAHGIKMDIPPFLILIHQITLFKASAKIQVQVSYKPKVNIRKGL